MSSQLEVTGEMIMDGIVDKVMWITTAKNVGLHMEIFYLLILASVSSPENQVSFGLYFKLHGETFMTAVLCSNHIAAFRWDQSSV